MNRAMNLCIDVMDKGWSFRWRNGWISEQIPVWSNGGVDWNGCIQGAFTDGEMDVYIGAMDRRWIFGWRNEWEGGQTCMDRKKEEQTWMDGLVERECMDGEMDVCIGVTDRGCI